MAADAPALQEFVLEVGRALILAGTAVSETQERLARIAAANGAAQARVVALPTWLAISLAPAGPTMVEPVPQQTGTLRLDQVAALYDLVRRAERGLVEPADGLARVREIQSMPRRFGAVVTVLGYLAMTVGLCLILQPTQRDIAVTAGLGGLVGCLVVATHRYRTLRMLVPFVAALVVAALTFQLVKLGFLDPGLRTLIASLATFLPGGMLATATVELASGEMVAGASRLVSGAFQLLLLSFGIVAGADLVGLPRADVLVDTPDNQLGWWAPWLGVVVFGIAVTYYFSAPRGTLGWLLLVLFTAWTVQSAARLVLGAAASGFAGALAMTPVALAVSRRPGGPPSQVTFLPAFWLLAPGAIGLLNATQAVGNPAAGLQGMVQPFASILALALGVLCGASIDRAWSARRV